ncbi:MFS transporter [Chitinasiproducens palmae]|uniref:MFS transporter, ACS family, phthalate transporter n=1 Tax=Chitinasiproducens palmae TaxID=1770053 RepID=A0A1H2PVA5_9BURK|nr:MFS transporter [Chitinasiproducens palmae]SDV50767.1 MFS transporter, ACS family, phthalate transporter [Chitinasiproducens palmae]
MSTVPSLACADRAGIERSAYRKIDLRIAAVLFGCFVLSFIDRVNVSYAHLQMRQDIGLSDEQYGFAVGLLFFSYVLFEVPSNLAMARIGARKTLSRIMILWGIVSTLTMAVQTPTHLYIARLALGAAEAGFFPGALLFFTYWYPAKRRARVIGFFALAVPVSGFIGGPISGWILHAMNDVGGMHAWRWLFLIEGLPSIVVGVLLYCFLTERPADARWLNATERALVVEALAAEQRGKGNDAASHRFGAALRTPRLYVAALAYTAVPWVANVITYWSPSILKQAGAGNALDVGLLLTIPYTIGAIGMLLICRSSDLRLERRWHWAASGTLAALSLLALPLAMHDLMLTVVVFAFMTIGFLGIAALFFTIPLAYLSGTAAAGGLALISALGQLMGSFAPMTIGHIKQSTGSVTGGLYVVAGVVLIAVLVVLFLIPARVLHERR